MQKSQIDKINIQRSKPNVLGANIFWQDFGWVYFSGLALLALVSLSGYYPFLNPLRLAIGCIYVLYVPGYCLTVALFPRLQELDGIERAGLSLGMSIAVISVIIPILDRFPWGLGIWPILIGEYIVTVVAIFIALFRRALQPADNRVDLGFFGNPFGWWGSLIPMERKIYLLTSGAIFFAALSVSLAFAVLKPDESMTEFYLLGPEGLAEGYPRQAQVGKALQVNLGVVNRERQDAVYRLEVWVSDSWNPQRRQQVFTFGPFPLARGQTFESKLPWSMPWAGKDQQVDFLLFQDASPHPYRTLRLYIDVTEAP